MSAASAASPAPSPTPTAGGELALDLPVYGSSSSWESDAVIATGGGGYLAAWRDGRGTGDGLYASRLAGDGRTVLDPTGIQLTDAVGAAPAISFDGTNYLVAWAESGDVLGIRVAETGLIVDASPFRIGDAPGVVPLATTFDGKRTIVVWEGDRLLRRAWVGRDGIVETETPRAFQTGRPAQSAPTLTHGNAGTILTWCERDASRTTGDVLHVALSGDTLPDPGSATTLAADPPAARCPAAVTALDGGFFASWREAPLDGSAPSIVAMPIGADGVPVASDLWTLASGVQIISRPSVAIDGGQLLVCWQENTAGNTTIVAGRRLTPAGELLDAATELLSAPQWGLPGAPVATAALPGTAGWVVVEAPYPAVTALRIDPTAPGSLPTNGTPVSTAANDERSAAASFGGGVYLVVWTDRRSQDRGDVYGARVSPNGEVLDRSAIPIAVAPDAQYEPTVAFDGADFLVVWTDDRNGVSLGTDTHGDVYAARVSPAGVVRDAKGIAIVNADGHQGRPTVACRAGTCVVAWVDDVTRAIDVTPLRFGHGSAASPSISAPTEIRSGPYLHDMPAIASNGADFLLAWIYSAKSIDAIRLDANGRVVDQQPIVVSDSATNPAVAASGDTYLVVWEDKRDGIANAADIYAARVTSFGELLDPGGIPVAVSPSTEQSPVVVSAADGFFVAWKQETSSLVTAQGNLLGVVVGADASVNLAATVPIAIGPGRRQAPALATPDDGTALLAYELFDPDRAFGSVRVRARPLTGLPAVPSTPSSSAGCSCAAAASPASNAGGACPLVLLAAVTVRRARARVAQRGRFVGRTDGRRVS